MLLKMKQKIQWQICFKMILEKIKSQQIDQRIQKKNLKKMLKNCQIMEVMINENHKSDTTFNSIF